MKDLKEVIKDLKEKNIPIYSISKLNTLEECYYEYYLTYIAKEKGEDNIYGFMGTKIHSCLEHLQNGEKIDFISEINQALKDSKVLGYSFPNESIEQKWEKNILDFAEKYKVPLYKKFETEKLFLYEFNNHFIQGIIDLLVYNDDGTISIFDYKTSGKFSKKDLETKGRQLILYGLAMEQLGFKIKSVAWNMLKYVKIDYLLKNGNVRSSIVERGFIIDKLQKDILKELLNLGYDMFEAEALISSGIESNSFEIFPKEIQNKYIINDYILEYDFNEKTKQETLAFMDAKINEIEFKQDDIDYWTPKEINNFNDFYCFNLCSRKAYCDEFKQYKEIKEEIDKQLLDEKAQEEFDELSKIF